MLVRVTSDRNNYVLTLLFLLLIGKHGMLAGTLLALIYSDTYCGSRALLWTLTSAGYLPLWVARCHI